MTTKDEALKLALEALGWTDEWRPQGLREEAITALREALNAPLASEAKEQPAPVAKPHEQEPEYAWPTVADYERDVGFETNEAFRMAWNMARTTNKMLGHTSPPAQRTWVHATGWRGLTDEEFQWVYDHGRTPAGMMEMVEAKLKEKNT